MVQMRRGDGVLITEDADDLGVPLALAVEPLDGLVECSLADRCGGDLMYRRRVSSPRASAGSGIDGDRRKLHSHRRHDRLTPCDPYEVWQFRTSARVRVMG
jgi:hypothetical protein